MTAVRQWHVPRVRKAFGGDRGRAVGQDQVARAPGDRRRNVHGLAERVGDALDDRPLEARAALERQRVAEDLVGGEPLRVRVERAAGELASPGLTGDEAQGAGGQLAAEPQEDQEHEGLDPVEDAEEPGGAERRDRTGQPAGSELERDRAAERVADDVGTVDPPVGEVVAEVVARRVHVVRRAQRVGG